MRTRGIVGWLSGALALLLLAAPRLAAAAALADFKAVDDGRKVVLTFRFEPASRPDVVYHYQANFVGLRLSGLVFTKAQLKGDSAAAADSASAYRFVRYVQDKEGGEARIYLTKPLTPADAQVVPYEDRIEVTLIKPRDAAAAPTTVDADPTAPAAAPADAGDSAAAGDQPGSFRPVVPDGSAAATDPLPPTDAPVEPAADGPAPGSSEPEPADLTEPAASEPEPAPAQPGTSGSAVGGRPYTQFNLSSVPVNMLVIRNKPFREALMEIVADSGFNVVVSDEVDNSEVSLNFTQKEISLKGALDLLSIAYDLIYTVEPDAIVIRAK